MMDILTKVGFFSFFESATVASGCGMFSCINNNLNIQKSSFYVLTMELLIWTYSSLGPITSVRLTLRLGVAAHACTHRLGELS